MDSAQPIIVKKIKKGGHGHHGGAWKVAFADFVTAMMAFFMLMWLMGSTTPEQRAAISDYFQNPSAVQGPGGASTSMIKMGAIDQQLNNKNKVENSQVDKTKAPTQVVEQVEVEKDKQRLDNLKQALEQAIDASPTMKPFKDQLLLDITPEGLRIQIIDKEGRPMFDSGSSTLKPYTEEILHEMAKLINKVPNRISLTGHTDATPYSSMRGYSNWELSADRANASRRALVAGGLDEVKVAKVVGLSSTVLFDKANPRSPVNRRISLIVLNKAAEQALQLDNGGASVGDVQAMEQVMGSDASVPKPPLEAMPAVKPVTHTPGAGTGKALTPKSLAVIPLQPRKTPAQLPQRKPEAITPVKKPRSLAPTPLGKPPAQAAPALDVHRAPASAKIQPIRPIQPFNPIQLPTAPQSQ